MIDTTVAIQLLNIALVLIAATGFVEWFSLNIFLRHHEFDHNNIPDIYAFCSYHLLTTTVLTNFLLWIIGAFLLLFAGAPRYFAIYGVAFFSLFLAFLIWAVRTHPFKYIKNKYNRSLPVVHTVLVLIWNLVVWISFPIKG